MKTVYITTMMITAVLMLIFPLSAKNTVNSLPVSATPVINQSQKDDSSQQVRVKITATGEITSFSTQDYIFGVVAAEMPALYETEALKAQTVAAYTYYLLQKESNSDKDYDITDDYTVDQAFITPEAAVQKWGSGAEEYEAKIRSAVKEVLYKKVTYNGELASTVYHAISFGVTEMASEVWGGEYPYLISVDSSWDKLHDNYLATVTLTAQELKSKLSSVAELKSETENCIGNIICTKAGGVKSLDISGKTVSGNEIRAALELRSANFTVEFKDEKYTFTTKGYGHAIGMSQYGAHYMAMQGKTYNEILLHYYPGCKVE